MESFPRAEEIKPEIITSGTPGFTHALRYELFQDGMMTLSERLLYGYKQYLRGYPSTDQKRQNSLTASGYTE